MSTQSDQFSGYAVKFAIENVGLEPTDEHLTEALKMCILPPRFFRMLDEIRADVVAYRASTDYAEWLERAAAEARAVAREKTHGVPLAAPFRAGGSGAAG